VTTDDVLTIPDTARRLKISVASTYRLIHRGDLPARRVGRQLRVSVASLDAWFQRGATGDAEKPAGLATVA